MNDWKSFTAVQTSAGGSGARPRVRDYVAVRMADNGMVIAMFVLLVVTGSAAVFVKGDGGVWARDIAKVILGVFLGRAAVTSSGKQKAP